MDEWPELEALGQAVDAWDDWPYVCDAPVQAVIDAARTVVDNYRTQKAAIEAYRNMAVDRDQVRMLMGLPPLKAADAPRPEMGEYVSHQSGWDSGVTHPGRRATCSTCPGLPTDDSAASRAGAAAADQALDQLGLPVTEPARVKAMIEIPMPEDQQSCACGDPNRLGWYHSRVTGRCYATGLAPE